MGLMNDKIIAGGYNMSRPVLMTPLRRCGSHALRLRLNFSPEFYSPYPLHVVDFLPLVPLYGDLNDDRRYFQFVIDILGLQAVSPVKWPDIAFDIIPFFDKVKNLPRNIHTIAIEMLLQAADKKNARIAMDKSLDNIHDWALLADLYPQMLFLNVIRDPRAQVSSMNRAIIYEFDSLLNAQIWARAFSAADALAKKFPERVLTIRFEDFISHEKETLQKICTFMEIPFLPQMLDIAKSEEGLRISQQSSLWESNSSAPIPANIDKFKKTLTDLEIGCIETVTGKWMDQYGYARMTNTPVVVTEEQLQEARQKSSERRAKAWEDLKVAKPFDYLIRRRRADYIEMCRQNLIKNF